MDENIANKHKGGKICGGILTTLNAGISPQSTSKVTEECASSKVVKEVKVVLFVFTETLCMTMRDR
jgi:hypothetical protein